MGSIAPTAQECLLLTIKQALAVVFPHLFKEGIGIHWFTAWVVQAGE